MDAINKRVLKIMDAIGISKSQFAAELGISLPLLTHISSGRNKPSLDLIIRIIQTYRQISINWILFGEGEMFNKPSKKIDLDDELNALQQQIEKINEIVSNLAEVIKYNHIFINEIRYLEQLSLLVKHQQEKALEINETLLKLKKDINNKVML